LHHPARQKEEVKQHQSQNAPETVRRDLLEILLLLLFLPFTECVLSEIGPHNSLPGDLLHPFN